MYEGHDCLRVLKMNETLQYLFNEIDVLLSVTRLMSPTWFRYDKLARRDLKSSAIHIDYRLDGRIFYGCIIEVYSDLKFKITVKEGGIAKRIDGKHYESKELDFKNKEEVLQFVKEYVI